VSGNVILSNAWRHCAGLGGSANGNREVDIVVQGFASFHSYTKSGRRFSSSWLRSMLLQVHLA
jgi:hypothetical protein